MYSACITRLHTATIQRYTSYIVDYTCIVYMYSAFAQGLKHRFQCVHFRYEKRFYIKSQKSSLAENIACSLFHVRFYCNKTGKHE